MATKTYSLTTKLLAFVLVVSLLLLGSIAWQRGWLQGVARYGSVILEQLPSPGSLLSSIRGDLPEETQKVNASLEKNTQSLDLKSKKKGSDLVDQKTLQTKNKFNKQAQVLNDKGVELILKKQYWQGMYQFKEALQLDENNFAAHQNMALALKEVGLTRPAARHFRKAESLRDTDPVLQHNYSIILGKGYGFEPEQQEKKPAVKVRFDGEKEPGSEQILRLWGLDVK